MKQIKGTSNRVLEVDLENQTHEIYKVTADERRLFLGAKGLGLKLLFDRMTPGKDPLGPDNIIAFMPGVLMGTGAPCSGRFDAVAKSPLTGIMVTSSCGGPFGLALKTAGWDGLLIKGKAFSPLYLDITKDGVEFKDAKDIWGMEIGEAQAVLDVKKAKSVVIGPAGENLVRYANMASGHRFLGRGGLGAVMGSKNLKAIRAQGGTYMIKPCDPKMLKKVKIRAAKYINQNNVTSDRYRNFGTSSGVRDCLKAGVLPVNNFQDGKHELGDQVSGEIMAEKHNTSHHTCKPCTIRCGHKGTFKTGEMSAPEYETIGLMGTSLGIFDLDTIAEFNHICGRLGLDTISTGGTLAWVMEAASKDLIQSNLKFGSEKGIKKALFDIANMKDFGAKMALGTRALSKEYGGQDFAMHVKGMEMAAYDPRGSFGQGLAYAVANKGGDHLSAYLIAHEVYFGLLKPDSCYGKAKWVKFFENLACCINSLQTCYFTMYAFLMEPPLSKYTPDFILGMLMQYLPSIAIPLIDFSIYTDLWNSVTGVHLSNKEFIKAGERIHVLERYMNIRERNSHIEDTLPERLLKQGRKFDNENKVVPLDKMLPEYYKIRGFDKDGIPLKKTLEELGIT
ncbi:MAG: aldehyde ferredoxin oxidoreductase family protein [Desulfobacteraceae bacterium]|nr:aldehyde ferredoxin oxidoreductase family protein [Desulfobacteraceae bacterium]